MTMFRERCAVLQHVAYLGFILLSILLAPGVAAPYETSNESSDQDSLETASVERREHRGPLHDAEPLDDELLVDFLQYLEHLAAKHVTTNTTTTTTEEPSVVYADLVLRDLMKQVIARYHRDMRFSRKHDNLLLNDSDEDHHYHHDGPKNLSYHEIEDSEAEYNISVDNSTEDDSKGLEYSSTVTLTENTTHQEQKKFPLHDGITTTERSSTYMREKFVFVSSTVTPTERSTAHVYEKTSLPIRSTVRPRESTTVHIHENTPVSSTVSPTERSTAHIYEKTSLPISSTVMPRESATPQFYETFPVYNSSLNITSKIRRENAEDRGYGGEIPGPPRVSDQLEHTLISKASLFKQTTQVAAILAGILVVCVVAGYLGVLTWRLIERKRNGNREKLVEEFDENDIRLYEL